MNYYKISPEWAKKLKVTDKGVKHPDGWFLLLPTYVMPLPSLLDKDEYGDINGIEEAVRAIGGCVYSKEEAIASQRGDKEYMMDNPETGKEE